MNLVDRFADACLRSAAARWPHDASDDLLREWRAELDAVAEMPGGPIRHGWLRLTFALSLATSPAVREPSIAGIWSDRVAGLGRGLAYFAMLGGVLLAARTLASLGRDLGGSLADLLGGPRHQLGAIVLVVAELLPVFAMVWLARAAARAFPQHRLARSPLGLAAVAAVPLTCVYALLSFATTGSESLLPAGSSASALGIVGAGLLSAVVLGAGLSQAMRGRRRLGMAVSGVAAVLGAEVTVMLTGISAARAFGVDLVTSPGWFPISLASFDVVHFGRFFPAGSYNVAGVAWSGPDLYGSELLLNPMLSLTTLLTLSFAVAYAWRALTHAVPAPVKAPVVPRLGRPLAPRWARLIALPLGAAGAVIWIYSTALTDYLEPNGPDGAAVTTDAVRRLDKVGLVLMVAAMAIHLAGRGPLVGPVVLAFLAPALAGQFVHSQSWYNSAFVPTHPVWVGWASAAALAVVAALSLGGAWCLSRSLAIRGADELAARRTLLTLGVCAAIMVPSDVYGTAASTSHAMRMGYLCAALAWSMAVLLVVVCRPHRLGLVATVAFLVVPGATALYAVPSVRLDGLYGPSPDLMVPLMLAVLVVAAVAWDRPSRSLLAAVGWLGAIGVVGALSMVVSMSLPEPATMLSASTQISGGQIVGWTGPDAILLLGVAIGVLSGRRIFAPPDEPDAMPTKPLATVTA